jgi:dTDP-4-amino-4,6-dideoxygalactose transaminase
VHFVPVHLHPYYRETLAYREGALPNAERIGASTLSLPLSGRLGEEDVDDVIGALQRVCRVGARVGAA